MDQFKDFPATLTSPATNAIEIIPDDLNPLDMVTRGLYVGQTGDISVEMQSGQIVGFQKRSGWQYPSNPHAKSARDGHNCDRPDCYVVGLGKLGFCR